MTKTPVKPQLSFEQFIENIPDVEGCYELFNGEIMRILPTRRRETIA
ncbi:MAG: hypothetical protein QNJ68_14265 [Microcoleaceae cyanobacterium MO_207.B10]|nr:hypothetical protein [Microcoleaceae cyanobacterium MO_207.B10]